MGIQVDCTTDKEDSPPRPSLVGRGVITFDRLLSFIFKIIFYLLNYIIYIK